MYRPAENISSTYQTSSASLRSANTTVPFTTARVATLPGAVHNYGAFIDTNGRNPTIIISIVANKVDFAKNILPWPSQFNARFNTDVQITTNTLENSSAI